MPYEVLDAATPRYEVLGGVSDAINNDEISQGARNFAGEGWGAKYLNTLAGAVRGAGSIGATIAAPYDYAMDALKGDRGKNLSSLVTGQELPSRNAERRAQIDQNMQELLGADPNSLLYKTGKIGGEIAGTAGVGGALAAPLRGLATMSPAMAPTLGAVARGLETGGFRVGSMAGTPTGMAVRAGTGAAVGGASAGLVDPQEAGLGAVIGGALPLGAQLAGATGSLIRRGFGGGVSPEVRDLAQRAQDLNINIPADRLVNSRPLNALASSLNYVPFSGRAATEDAMVSQLNRQLSNSFGQDSGNVTMALRNAERDLGGKFESVLSQNGVKFDEQLLNDLATTYNKAEQELGSDALKPISSKINEIVQKGQSGVLDGQAAYNIKRDLDRIGNTNNPNAWHALELKGKLMDALNRSLGPEQAAAFAETRQQYGNMLDLQKFAKNGAEGEISAARLANMQNIRDPKVQELADIAAQFVKGREGQHGAAQRVFGAGGVLGVPAALSFLGLPGAGTALLSGGAAVGAGRAMNGILNSNAARNFMLGPIVGEPEPLGLLTRGAYRALPLLADQ